MPLKNVAVEAGRSMPNIGMSSYLSFELGVKTLAAHPSFLFPLVGVYYAYTTPDECLSKLSVSIERRVSLFRADSLAKRGEGREDEPRQ